MIIKTLKMSARKRNL
ncbi:hypothetical protein [Escherichia coli]|nr:hypothetical protein [Escherichia coli]MCV8129611.1 hypothetical protein [Escherichia coli]HBH4491979.1 hypothetical protein [Escherichia coli]